MKDTYQQLEALSLPLLKAHQSDLTEIDRKDIEEDHSGVPFLHFTRESGTHIVLMPEADHESWPAKGERTPFLFGEATREHILDQVIPVLEGIQGRGNTLLGLHFDGKALRKITVERALEVGRAYVDRVRRAWGQAKREFAAH